MKTSIAVAVALTGLFLNLNISMAQERVKGNHPSLWPAVKKNVAQKKKQAVDPIQLWSPAQPTPRAQFTQSVSDVRLSSTRKKIAEEAQAVRLAGMLTKPKRSLWNGVDEKSHTDGRSKLRIFGFRGDSWPSCVEVQYHDLGSVRDDCQTPPVVSIFGVVSLSLP